MKVEANLDATADTLRGYFIDAKSAKSGKRHQLHARFRRPEIWLAAAELCNSLNALPYDFIKAAFMFCTVPGGPFPQSLAGGAARKWYLQYQAMGTEPGKPPPDDIYKAEISRLIRDIGSMMMNSGKRPMEFLLDDYMLPIHTAPAFVRVILLSKSPDILRKFGKKARSEIIGNQRLLTMLTELQMDLTWLEKLK